jgi:hypothetical protein
MVALKIDKSLILLPTTPTKLHFLHSAIKIPTSATPGTPI